MTKALSNLQERKRREADARRKHITGVVKTLIKKGGAREITIRKVAEEAGFSTTVVYSLYKDKATLITQAMDEDLLELVRVMKQASDGVEDPMEKIFQAGIAYVNYGMSNPDEYALVFMERRPVAPIEAATVEHGNLEQDPYAFAHSLFVQLAATGAVRNDDESTHQMTQVFWQGVHGLTSLGLVMPEEEEWMPRISPEKQLETLLQVLMTGISIHFKPVS